MTFFDSPGEAAAMGAVQTVQDALHKFSRMIAAKWLCDEAADALDSGCDYKLTITVTEKPNGCVALRKMLALVARECLISGGAI